MKNKVIQIRFEDVDAKRLQNEADRFGLTLSAWARMRLLLDLDQLRKLQLDGIDKEEAK